MKYGAEPLSGYKPGGYHPVHLGDKFHGNRFIVVHKLGWGSYSTIWLARDTAAPEPYVKASCFIFSTTLIYGYFTGGVLHSR
jgi:hypothetical protein